MGRQPLGHEPDGPAVGERDVDVGEVRLATGIGVDTGNAHADFLPELLTA